LTRSPRPPYAARMAKKKAKPGRGGKRAGAGRPVTVGVGSSKPISFKLAPDDRSAAEEAAEQAGVSVGEWARRATLEALGKWARRVALEARSDALFTKQHGDDTNR
jgi:hypothetical protein